jgi:hypothetical protein
VSIDRAGLAALARSQHAGLGIEEEFLRPTLGGARTVAIRSRPLAGSVSEIGWVICHSFGMEQIHLYRMEVRVARALSAAGFVVLRYHSQGYGDSELGASDVTLESHVAAAMDAAQLVREDGDVRGVAALGARFGGLVAATIAARGLADRLVLIEPVVQGRRFMRDFLWQRVFSEMASSGEQGEHSAATLLDQLATRGWVDVNGFLLRREGFEEISNADLLAVLEAFRGPALVVSVSGTSQPTASSRGLFERLSAARDDRTTLDVVTDDHAPEFGRSHFRADDEVLGKADTQSPINRGIVDRVVAWARAQSGAPTP